jgi:ABC-type phosphate transport system substrate-binding protein
MRTARAVSMLLALAVGAIVAAASAAGKPPDYQVVVNPNNPVIEVDRDFLAGAFLKKTTSWPNDETIKPVDQIASSPVRRQFSEDVIRRTVSAVKGYWQQRIFSGRDVPPPEFDSEEDVVKYVMKHDGAVGYVSSSANLQGAHVLSVR